MSASRMRDRGHLRDTLLRSSLVHPLQLVMCIHLQVPVQSLVPLHTGPAADHTTCVGMNRDHPLGRDFLELQRKSAKGYTCPVCGDIFTAEPKLWDHGSRNHPGYLEDLGSTEKAEGGARKRFRQEALDQTYVQIGDNLSRHLELVFFRVLLSLVSSYISNQISRLTLGIFRQQKAPTTGKAGPAAEDRSSQPKPFPKWRNSAGEYASEDAKAGSDARPASAPGYFQAQEKKIEENIEDLTLQQAKSKEQNDRSVSTNNPRKRGVGGESRLPVSPIGGDIMEPVSTRPRHGKTLSGDTNPEIVRQGVPPDDSEYRRGNSGPRLPLWDPSSDSPSTGKVGRREKQHSHINPLRRFHPPKDFYSSYQGPELAEKDVLHPHPDSGYGKPLVQQSFDSPGGQSKQPDSPEVGRGTHSSESPPGGDLPGDETLDGPEDEPEMLLQPETRPISHEQLVVEVKGIYAGLVMVEAKCIDIDERQSAAAQEKDLSKKTELKNDQWQSLIALHKQVRN